MKLVQQGRLTDEQIAQAEANKIAKDQKKAKQRLDAEKEAIDAQAAADAKRLAREAADAQKAENAALKKQIDEREKFLATPLSEEDQARLTLLTGIANSGKSVAVELMKELADLRVRAKVEVKKDKK